MCVAFSPALIREFWENHRAVDDEPLPLADLFRLLMDKHATVPAAYDYRVTNSLEPFLLAQGLDSEEFVKFASYMSSYHPYYSPEQILFRATKPILSKLATIYDPRRAVVALLQQVVSSIMPEHVSRSVKRVGSRSNIIVLRYPGVDRFPFVHDYHYYCRIQIVHAPSIFGYPPFTQWIPLSDARPVDRCLIAGERVAIDGGELRINGRLHGHVVPSFVLACRERHGLALGPSTTTDRAVVLVDSEYCCPTRRRVVLTEGCLYDAPYYLTRIAYDPIPVEKEDYVRRLFTLVANADRIADKKVIEMHNALTSSRIRIVYNGAEQRCEVLAATTGPDPQLRRLLSLAGTEARIMRCLAYRLAESRSRGLSVSCLDIVREVYGFAEDSRPKGHRSFYVALKRLTQKVNRDAAGNLKLHTVSYGRSKSIQVECPTGPIEYSTL
jgi:hypothetical protein